GFPGTVILSGKCLNALTRLNATSVRLQAGVACPKAAKFCADNALAGASFFAGIPGTVGGALAMNAGAYGGETWDLVSAVQTVDRMGRLHQRSPDEFTIGYRSVSGATDQFFVAADLQLTPGAVDTLRQEIRVLLRKRVEAQPTGQRSCGSVFRNPEGDYAGRLIEACGLKGFQVGQASVSQKHANFIINEGGASADDIESLISSVADEVRNRHGIELVPEVRIVGETRTAAGEDANGR
ncbi:MAG: UDP-N-acetylmuramate dehydrogenase, partial [Gammaproteobacteria bacterium]|nr:UDP-N-acetylmuramate dehydrogenase [Gammaproteobacteria bacterium]